MLADRSLRFLDVGAEAGSGEQVHVRVVERVTPDEVTSAGDRAGHFGLRLDPASLEEERGARAMGRQRIQDRRDAIRLMVRAVRMFGVNVRATRNGTPVLLGPIDRWAIGYRQSVARITRLRGLQGRQPIAVLR
jgi:hypothetical protein